MFLRFLIPKNYDIKAMHNKLNIILIAGLLINCLKIELIRKNIGELIIGDSSQ